MSVHDYDLDIKDWLWVIGVVLIVGMLATVLIVKSCNTKIGSSPQPNVDIVPIPNTIEFADSDTRIDMLVALYHESQSHIEGFHSKESKAISVKTQADIINYLRIEYKEREVE